MVVEEEAIYRMGVSAATNLLQALEGTLPQAIARPENEVEELPMQLELRLYLLKTVNGLQALARVMDAESVRVVKRISVRKERQQTRNLESPNQPVSGCPQL